MDIRQLAEEAIGLFLEYRDRHGFSEDHAMISAAQEVVDGSEAYEPEQGIYPYKLVNYVPEEDSCESS